MSVNPDNISLSMDGANSCEHRTLVEMENPFNGKWELQTHGKDEHNNNCGNATRLTGENAPRVSSTGVIMRYSGPLSDPSTDRSCAPCPLPPPITPSFPSFPFLTTPSAPSIFPRPKPRCRFQRKLRIFKFYTSLGKFSTCMTTVTVARVK